MPASHTKKRSLIRKSRDPGTDQTPFQFKNILILQEIMRLNAARP